MPLYLLDSSVAIRAHQQYYPISRVPEFWEWLIHHGTTGNLKFPEETYEEFTGGHDELSEWANVEATKQALILPEELGAQHVQYVVDNGYANDLTDVELNKLGRDPFLVAHGLTDPGNRCIVTTEGSKPSRRRANRHVPDVCRSLNIECIDPFKLFRELNFSTRWRSA